MMLKEKVLDLFNEYSLSKINDTPLASDFNERVNSLRVEISMWTETEFDTYLYELLQCLAQIARSDNTMKYNPTRFKNVTNDINIWYEKLHEKSNAVTLYEAHVFNSLFKNYGLYATQSVIYKDNIHYHSMKKIFPSTNSLSQDLFEIKKFFNENKDVIIPYRILYFTSDLKLKNTDDSISGMLFNYKFGDETYKCEITNPYWAFEYCAVYDWRTI